MEDRRGSGGEGKIRGFIHIHTHMGERGGFFLLFCFPRFLSLRPGFGFGYGLHYVFSLLIFPFFSRVEVGGYIWLVGWLRGTGIEFL